MGRRKLTKREKWKRETNKRVTKYTKKYCKKNKCNFEEALGQDKYKFVVAMIKEQEALKIYGKWIS